jgi:hypothetical protein
VSILRVGAISVGVVSASTWIGSLVCLAAVSQVARRELSGSSRIALFRGVGRLYRIIGTTSLLTSIAIGLALAWPVNESVASVRVMFALSGALLGVTALGMAQARRMTLVRRQLLAHPDDGALAHEVRRGGVAAGVLRGAIAIITLAIVVLGATAVA